MWYSPLQVLRTVFPFRPFLLSPARVFSRPFDFAGPLFSYSSEMLFPAPLCFDIPPDWLGVWGLFAGSVPPCLCGNPICRSFVFIFLRIAFPASHLFSQPSELPRGGGATHSSRLLKLCRQSVSSLESALTKNWRVSPLESALTKTPGVGGALVG